VGITILGIVLIPLSLVSMFNPIRLLQIALVSSVFEAAAALIFGGSFGLQPAMVPGLLFVAYIAVQYGLGMRYPGEGVVLSVMSPLLAFLFYALLSIMILPDAFAGIVFVWPQKPDMLAYSTVPLEFSFGNVTQAVYLLINVVFATAVAIFLTRVAVPYERIVSAYLAGGYVVVFIVFWQFANRTAGVPFPTEVLQSNPGWAIVKQSIGSVPRMQGPFSEPAGLALYLSGLSFCCLWLGIRGSRFRSFVFCCQLQPPASSSWSSACPWCWRAHLSGAVLARLAGSAGR
jgi:hypothetical protein